MIKISTTDCSKSALSQSWKYHKCVERFGDLKLFITEKHNSGMTQKQIAEFMQISDPALKSWLVTIGLKLTRHKETKPRANNTQKQAYDLRESGLNYDKIAETMGITRMRAWQKVKAWSSRITQENAQ